MVSPRLVFKIAIFVVYVVIGFHKSNVAHRYLIDPDVTHWGAPMIRPELFRPEGEPYRKAALHFIRAGIFVVLALWFIV
jgi:hypothetical protein